MKITKANIRWDLDLGNDPKLEILAENTPSLDQFRYEHRNGIWYAEHESGFVSFYHWVGPHNEGGFGGDCFNITMKNSDKVRLKGPWSSNSNSVNSIGFGPCVEINCNMTCWAITIKLAKKILEKSLPEVELYPLSRWGGISYIPTLKGKTPDESKSYLRRQTRAKK